MKSNYDRSKSISRKTTKNYHPRADDPRLFKDLNINKANFFSIFKRKIMVFGSSGEEISYSFEKF